MSILSDLLFRARALFRRHAVEEELEEELRFHFDRQVEKYVKAGEFDYVRDVPAAAFRGGVAIVDFALDKTLPPAGVEPRELGVVANTIGFEAT